MHHSAQLHARAMLSLRTSCALALYVVLGLDVLGIHTISLAARKRTAANSGSLASGLAKVQAAREYDLAPFVVFYFRMEREIAHPPMAHSTMEAHEMVRRLIVLEELLTFPMIRNKLPRICPVTKSQSRILPNLLLYVSPESFALQVDSVLRISCLT